VIAFGAMGFGVVKLIDAGGPRTQQHSSSRSPAAAPRCDAGQLRLAPTFYGAAGQQFMQTLTFTNVSAHACRISGWPRVVGVSSRAGMAMSIETRRVVQGPESARPFRAITVRSRAASSFDIYGADWDNLADRPCPRTSALVITQPGSSERIRVAATVPDCPGGFYLAPLVPGRTDRQAWSFVWRG
jgi:hypothetical protein